MCLMSLKDRLSDDTKWEVSKHQGTCCSSKDQQWHPQLPRDSSIQQWLLDMFYFFPSPLIAWKALETWSSFSSLRQQCWFLGHCKALWFVPHMVWYAVTLQMCQSLRSLGWETEANMWMVLFKKNHKETAHQDSPSAHGCHLIAEISLLCSCFALGKVGPCFFTSLPDGEEGHAPPDRVTSGTSWEVV